jgi:hypothetical protein
MIEYFSKDKQMVSRNEKTVTIRKQKNAI